MLLELAFDPAYLEAGGDAIGNAIGAAALGGAPYLRRFGTAVSDFAVKEIHVLRNVAVGALDSVVGGHIGDVVLDLEHGGGEIVAGVSSQVAADAGELIADTDVVGSDSDDVRIAALDSILGAGVGRLIVAIDRLPESARMIDGEVYSGTDIISFIPEVRRADVLQRFSGFGNGVVFGVTPDGASLLLGDLVEYGVKLTVDGEVKGEVMEEFPMWIVDEVCYVDVHGDANVLPGKEVRKKTIMWGQGSNAEPVEVERVCPTLELADNGDVRVLSDGTVIPSNAIVWLTRFPSISEAADLNDRSRFVFESELVVVSKPDGSLGVATMDGDGVLNEWSHIPYCLRDFSVQNPHLMLVSLDSSVSAVAELLN